MENLVPIKCYFVAIIVFSTYKTLWKNISIKIYSNKIGNFKIKATLYALGLYGRGEGPRVDWELLLEKVKENSTCCSAPVQLPNGRLFWPGVHLKTHPVAVKGVRVMDGVWQESTEWMKLPNFEVVMVWAISGRLCCSLRGRWRDWWMCRRMSGNTLGGKTGRRPSSWGTNGAGDHKEWVQINTELIGCTFSHESSCAVCLFAEETWPLDLLTL